METIIISKGSAYPAPTFYEDFTSPSWLTFDGSHWPPLAGPGRWARSQFCGWPSVANGAGCRFDPADAQSFEDGGVTIDGQGLALTSQLVSRLSAADKAAMVSPQQQWRSGMVAQNPAFAMAFGYFEWVAQLPPAGTGFWPALWLLNADYSSPQEIDVLESIGDPTTIYCTPHSGVAAAQAKCVCQKVALGFDGSAGFHKYGLLWTPAALTWFVDDRQVDQQATPPDMVKPMYMIASFGVGGASSWPGAGNANTPSPAVMRVRRVASYALGSWGAGLIPATLSTLA